ncbi:acyl-CoA dehydrogenase [Pseudomaricurvus alkylphenolicus]|uniref:acyl-CoA dehydrogenase family protein n=1 Tax=Pseudomaricurvus alkylphenolicus TaxID=1306991 RepID=UPI00141F533C|nr:acyl-CoA dehydrogenase [Pseudomaricurvus alkylphenolicus]NIB41667.1 acyl-CoA dehydrogenase [Pseudomaricurvus alkylphenolicus]
MFTVEQIPMPNLGLTGLAVNLSEEELAIQDVAHRFARDVMRPIGEQLDKMTPEQVAAPESPLWSFLQQLRDSGLIDLEAIAAMDNAQKARLVPIIFEELGWGDSGLTICALAGAFPAFAAYNTGNPELIERFGHLRGCWIGTQPDRGSDMVDYDKSEAVVGSRHNKPNLHARVEGNELIVNGQSSAWVSGAPIAECGLLNCPCDYDGNGIYREDGGLNSLVALVPFDLPGVSKGKALDKIGQRALPQGEIYFDEVRIPLDYVIADKELAYPSFYGALTFANMEMAATFTGVARAAFEHALDYVHERKQGGGLLIEHQSVRLRLFDLWRKVESSRAMSQRVFDYNYGPKGPHLLASLTSKTFVTQSCFEVCNDAMQLFGGNGLTREYPLEKLLRDARAALVEDGENTVLSLKGGSWLSHWYKANH